MEEVQTNDQEVLIKQLYAYAANRFKQGADMDTVKASLMEQGLTEENATYIVNSFAGKIYDRDKAQKDALYGGLWCLGGILLTVAQIGFIFWGAILYGAIRFIKGIIYLSKS